MVQVKQLLGGNDLGKQGISEIDEILEYLKASNLEDHNLEFDVTLARGLSYYTGAIFEVKAHNVKIGSVSGGGRYDDLTGVFGLPDVSGVGVSFGVDRLYDVLEELNLFPKSSKNSTQILISNFDKESEIHGMEVLSALRQSGIKTEIYPESVKMKKQFSYADKKSIPYVLLIGSEEIESNIYSLKDLNTGEQSKLKLEDIIALVSNK